MEDQKRTIWDTVNALSDCEVALTAASSQAHKMKRTDLRRAMDSMANYVHGQKEILEHVLKNHYEEQT